MRACVCVWSFRVLFAVAAGGGGRHDTFRGSVSFEIQRRGVPGTLSGATVIEKGDFLWCDFGHIGMELWTGLFTFAFMFRECSCRHCNAQSVSCGAEAN